MRFFSLNFLEKERNDSKTTQTSFLILVANNNNSKVILKSSSSIKIIWANGFVAKPYILKKW
jgi:hypothetical protein